MSQYTKQELEAAKTSLASTLRVREDSGERQAAIVAGNPERQAGERSKNRSDFD